MADRLHRGAGRGTKWRYILPEIENISTAKVDESSRISFSSPLVLHLQCVRLPSILIVPGGKVTVPVKPGLSLTRLLR